MLAKRFFAVLLSLSLAGCGYSLRRDRAEYLESQGVHKIYIAPVVNNTYRYGTENVIYNALLKSLISFKGFKIVTDPEGADAILTTKLNTADSNISSSIAATQLNPTFSASQLPQSFGSLYVASQYSASVTCSFALIRRGSRPGMGIVWSADFNRTLLYPASNQLGVLGTTSGLINDSEFNRAVVSIAQSMAQDVRESMVARF